MADPQGSSNVADDKPSPGDVDDNASKTSQGTAKPSNETPTLAPPSSALQDTAKPTNETPNETPTVALPSSALQVTAKPQNDSPNPAAPPRSPQETARPLNEARSPTSPTRIQPNDPRRLGSSPSVSTGSSVSLSIKGIHVNFTVEFAQIAWRVYSSLKNLFNNHNEQPPDGPTRTTSHTPRRVAFMLLSFAFATILVNFYYASSESPCLWRAHTDALAELQMSRIGVLLNSTSHSNSRVMELSATRIGVSELRTYVLERKADGNSVVALDAALKKYSDNIYLVQRKLLRVDASVMAVVQLTIAHNVATYEHLEISSYAPWWYSLFCWGACQGPSLEASYLGMLNLEDTILHALESTLYDAVALKDSIQRLHEESSVLQHHAHALGWVRSSLASDAPIDILPFLWDYVVPYRTPAALNTHRRRLLSGARSSLRRSIDHASGTQEDVLNLMEKMRLLKLGLKPRRGLDTSLFSSSRLESDFDLCTPSSERGVRAFKALLLAANELRAMLAR